MEKRGTRQREQDTQQATEEKAFQVTALPGDVSLAEHVHWQKNDPSSKYVWEMAVLDLEKDAPPTHTRGLFLVKGRPALKAKTGNQSGPSQMLTPSPPRWGVMVLQFTHDIPLAGHLGAEKTLSWVLQ